MKRRVSGRETVEQAVRRIRNEPPRPSLIGYSRVPHLGVEIDTCPSCGGYVVLVGGVLVAEYETRREAEASVRHNLREFLNDPDSRRRMRDAGRPSCRRTRARTRRR